MKWRVNDLDVATVEELNPEGPMEVQNLRALGMGWAWYVNDLSKYLPDAETLADMTPAEDISVGMDPGVPLKEIGLEPEIDPEREVMDPYVMEVPFPHDPPGPAETELMDGGAPALLPRSQEVDLVVSAINIPMPWHLRKALKPWSREDLHVRVFQGVRAGGPKTRTVCCRETFDMETGSLLAREYFDPGKGSTRLPTPALPGCAPFSSESLSVRSIFWYSEVDPLPESICAIAARCPCSCLCSTSRSPSGGRPPGGGCVSTSSSREASAPGNGGAGEFSSSASAREASLLKSGGEPGVSVVTTTESRVARKGQGWSGT